MTDFGITYDATSYLSNYGQFAYGPNIIIVHSLECDPIPHIAEELSAPGGYLDAGGLAPQRMTDPVSIVKCIPDGDQGGHIGGPGNSHCAGSEVSGRAAWVQSQWLDGGNAQAALEHDARAIAGLAIVYGWPYSDLRWLSIAQIRAGTPRGLASHNDITISGISATTHWDPGLGFPWAWFLVRVQNWYTTMTGGTVPVDPPKDDSMSAADVQDLKNYIDARTVNRTEGSHSTFDELRYAVRETIMPPLADVANRVRGSAPDADVLQLLGAAIARIPTAAAAVLTGGTFTIITDADTGWWYAAAPGHFWHLQGMEEVNQLVGADLLIGQTSLPHDQVIAIRTMVLRENDDVAPIPPPPAPTTYTVLAGDTWTSICNKFGLQAQELRSVNPQVTDVNMIGVGQVLTLPPK